ncbi:MAG: hypothetical protein HDT28_07935 [Clostridiales bacterium]|nr:hypothetical protein [Clostridiales bacterium]
MNVITIAVGGSECGHSPVMPYVGEKADGKIFTRLAALYLTAALIRCDFDVLEVPSPVVDARDMIMRVNRFTADGAVLISLGAFGSRKSFNDVKGAVVYHSTSKEHKVFCEDICAALSRNISCASLGGDRVWQGAVCPTAVVDAGYLTNFDEAKLSLDPDYAQTIAEHVAMGVCEYFGYPYIRQDDITAYPILCTAATGKRGRKIKMLQALLAANGMKVEVDGVYGKETDLAVKAFEQNNGLSGGVDAALWRELILPARKPLEYGCMRNGVLYIQRKLYSKLYDCPQSGELDDKTLTAINEFVRDKKLCAQCTKESGVSEEVIAALSCLGGGKPRLF